MHQVYTLAKELYPGRYRPTITHSFIKVLHAHSLLHTCFTQNIDTLERRAGVPEKKIIEAHGSFATQRCIECKRPYEDEKIKKAVINSTIPRCEHCRGLVKPDIVFFGEALPPRFHVSIRSLRHADLLIVMGTSLTVHPFASLVDLVPDDCPRVLINLDDVGDFDKQDDIILLGKCDDIVQELCCELGWGMELERAWAATADSVEVDGKAAVSETKVKAGEELDRITRDMEKSLAISKDSPGSWSNSDTGRTPGQKDCPKNEEVLDKKEVDVDSSVTEGSL
ncbi:DHS-like NAD/FAD-binding domain-containing protein [Butyriboletus roseoflavus]|nr:DHS-like NAD/FAD-binding domain-containing protein [Butyriboletus roseoflavus]